MRLSAKHFSNAADKFVDTEGRRGIWEAWPKYKIRRRKDGQRYVLRVEPNEADLGPRVGLEKALERTNGRVSPGSPEEEMLREAMRRDQARKESYPYRPLVREPDLFLKFARLADVGGLDGAEQEEELGTDKNAAVAEDWAHTYGVLGLTLLGEGGQRGASTLGGEKETVAAFAREAWVANGCLRLYEAATAEKLDVDLIGSYIGVPRYRDFHTRTPAAAREFALDEVATQTQHRIAGNVYPALYGEVGRFVQGWDFINLLGAMWLQMFWLLTSEETPRRCWQCGRVITYEQPDQRMRGMDKNDRTGGYRTRADRHFCKFDEHGKRDGCKNRYNYQTRTKPRRRQSY